MKYIIMCGGKYKGWETPRQLTEVCGERLIDRTIRLLKEIGIPVKDIAISTLSKEFSDLEPEILVHNNEYGTNPKSYWLDAFYPMNSPVCYLYGDVFYSPEAIERIVNHQTKGIMFFASASPFDSRYIKRWAEPFAFKVVDTDLFRDSIEKTKYLYDTKQIRRAISWELWQVIKGTQPGKIIQNYEIINDYTCDIDNDEEIQKIETILGEE